MFSKSPIIGAGLIFLLTGCATDVEFQSSDGVWEDWTCRLKGRSFESVLYYFEKYKFQSKRSSAELYRCTPRPSSWNLFWSISDRSDPKWNVPYREKLECPPDERWDRCPPCLAEKDNELVKKAAEDDLKYFSGQGARPRSLR